MTVRKHTRAGHKAGSAEADRRKADGAAEGRLEAERLARKQPDDQLTDTGASRAALSLADSEAGITLTARGGNAIPKGIRVVDGSGTLIAAYIGLALDDLSVAKSARSSVAGALALTLDDTDEVDEAKAESPSGVITGQTGEDVPVELTPGEFRNRAVSLFAGELINLSRELRASGSLTHQEKHLAGGAS
ncbi:hypothetical protein AB0C81_12125 [Streptomyces roseoverticillatus]|uniref:hypothetical protein n=1 Tax=Streptomyces roseoverticillatus TaxID=66429 RepID=UPI0033E7C6A2